MLSAFRAVLEHIRSLQAKHHALSAKLEKSAASEKLNAEIVFLELIKTAPITSRALSVGRENMELKWVRTANWTVSNVLSEPITLKEVLMIYRIAHSVRKEHIIQALARIRYQHVLNVLLELIIKISAAAHHQPALHVRMENTVR